MVGTEGILIGLALDRLTTPAIAIDDTAKTTITNIAVTFFIINRYYYKTGIRFVIKLSQLF